MVNYKEKIEGCIYLSSFLETLAFFNGKWEFNYGNKTDTITEGLLINYFFLNHYYMMGGLENINFEPLKSSDDTLLILATGEGVLNGGGEKNYIESYLKYLPVLKEEVRISGKSTLISLEKIKKTKSIKSLPYSSNNGGNGCAIRTAPIGLKYYKNINQVCEEALIASLVTHNYSIGFLGGIVTALFTAYAVESISPFKWSIELIKLYKKKVFHNLIKKYVKDNIDDEIDDFFSYWEKYNEDRLNKMNFRNLPNFLNPGRKIEDLINYTSVTYISKKSSYDKFGGSGLEATILAYDNLLLSAIPDKNMIVNTESPKFNWEVFVFNNVFFFGDNDSISAISASWYGAYLGIDKCPLEKIKELEFYNELTKVIDKLSK
jgi:ADP-ribosylglycohydrolase